MGDILALAGNIWQLHDKAGCWHHMKNGSSRACVLGVGRSMGSQEKNTDIADTYHVGSSNCTSSILEVTGGYHA